MRADAVKNTIRDLQVRVAVLLAIADNVPLTGEGLRVLEDNLDLVVKQAESVQEAIHEQQVFQHQVSITVIVDRVDAVHCTTDLLNAISEREAEAIYRQANRR